MKGEGKNANRKETLLGSVIIQIIWNTEVKVVWNVKDRGQNITQHSGIALVVFGIFGVSRISYPFYIAPPLQNKQHSTCVLFTAQNQTDSGAASLLKLPNNILCLILKASKPTMIHSHLVPFPH